MNIFAILMLLLLAKPSAETEVVYFSFKTRNDKTMTLSHNTTTNTLIYRFSNAKAVELEITDDLNDDTPVFTYGYYHRGGGADNAGLDLNQVRFETDDFKYEIYDNWSAEDNISSIGISVTDKTTGKQTNISGVLNTRSGRLPDLWAKELIPVENI
jgi:hypothetical protein